jgi:peptidoglycan/LPS O-acetylase OafA/YrhL
VARHGRRGFLRERFLRLGVPLLAFGLVIGPLTIALAQTVPGHPIGATLAWLWAHRAFESGPLWFAQALLIFAVAYLFVPWRPRRLAFPSNRTMVLALLVTGCGAFALRLAWPVGSTVSGLQAGYFAGYIVLFAAGCAGASGAWLTDVPRRQTRLWLAVACASLPVFPAVVLLLPGDAAGGLTVPAAVYAFWEPAVAWGTIMWLLYAFGDRFRVLGPFWARLSRRAYAIFVIHPPVLVAVAMAWRDVQAPHLVKFAVTGSVACAACHAIAGVVLRVPGVRRVL